jgi:hypothetical protein
MLSIASGLVPAVGNAAGMYCLLTDDANRVVYHSDVVQVPAVSNFTRWKYESRFMRVLDATKDPTLGRQPGICHNFANPASARTHLADSIAQFSAAGYRLTAVGSF